MNASFRFSQRADTVEGMVCNFRRARGQPDSNLQVPTAQTRAFSQEHDPRVCNRVGGKEMTSGLTKLPGGEETRRETALPAPLPRGNRIDEAAEEDTARWGRAVPAGRPRRVLEVPEASAMAGGGACQRRRKRDGSGKQVGERKDLVDGGPHGSLEPPPGLGGPRAIRSTSRAEERGVTLSDWTPGPTALPHRNQDETHLKALFAVFFKKNKSIIYSL